VEAAAQQLLLDQPSAAAAGFEAALKLDELHMQATLGLVEAHLALGQLEEAEQQLQFLPELLAVSRAGGASSCQGQGLGEVQGLFGGGHAASGGSRAAYGFTHVGGRVGLAATHGAARSRAVSDAGDGAGLQVVAGGRSAAEQVHHEEPLLLYLRGVLAWKQGNQQDGLQLLQQSLERQLEAVEHLPFGLGMLSALSASRMLGLLGLLLDSFGGDPRQPTDPPSALLGNCIRCVRVDGGQSRPRWPAGWRVGQAAG
jgi:hypothetical protein